MRSYLLPAGYRGETRIEISGPDHHYLARVLRLRAGDRFPGTDGKGCRYLLRVLRVQRSRLLAGVQPLPPEGGEVAGGSGGLAEAGDVPAPAAEGTETGRGKDEPAPAIHLLQCLPKGNRMDRIVRQATEAGVRRIVPLLSRNTIPRIGDRKDGLRKIRRWERIAREALQQSGNLELPDIAPPVRLEEIVRTELPGIRIFFHQGALDRGSLHALLAGAGREVFLLIGPEGGLAAAEVELLIARGFRPVHIGETVLRAETAALFAMAAVQMILKERDSWKLAP
jgi:16S rRNA (uracil1498-N3)-methyltransferase